MSGPNPNPGPPGRANLQWYNVYDFGAKALDDGVHADSAGINMAVQAALAAGGGTVYLPYGEKRIYRLDAPLVMYPSVSFVMAPSTELHPFKQDQPGEYNGNAVEFSPSVAYSNFGARYVFGRIAKFSSGAGIVIKDDDNAGALAFAEMSVMEIGYCKYGFLVQSTSTTNQKIGVFNAVCRFSVIRGCSYGIYLALAQGGTNSAVASEIQGCLFSGNSISGATEAAIYIIGPHDVNEWISANVFEVYQINGSSLTSGAGIVFDAVKLTSGNVFRVPGSFGVFAPGWHVAAANGGSADGQYFELAVWDDGGTDRYADYNGIKGTNTLKVVSQSKQSSGMIYNVGTDPALKHWIDATKSHNTRSSFNQGAPVFFQKVAIAFQLPQMVPGDTADFYVYSPFTTGVRRQPKYYPQETNGAAVLDVIEDTSRVPGLDGHQADNQVHVRFRAFGFIAADSLVLGVIEFAA
jgi:hypothetical protein